ncbi:MAG: hypothetical protein EPO55_25065 [Reyranella sp.]|uniref:hypothetical protein n=1 Tax=Reyranella sp. TaxID=1929291 RepID=UPI00121AFBBF|nr:hypothetical protein [Reyranella sp.]TAJ35733.1 MAG: hypothetical protein EPO55_25065 [Reyranella sp.]
MGTTIYPTVPVAQPAAEPWPPLSDNGDEHTIRVDEMFARQLDNEFSAGVRGLLHDPESGVAAQSGEAALEAIAGALPALNDLKERTLAQAIGPRQRGILEPLIETRLDWAAGTLGQLAQRATIEVDDASVADRIAGLNQDAATSWHDPAYLRKLGRTAVEELRYQGERRGWDAAETDTRVRAGLSDLYAGAVETAIGQDDLDGAAGFYEHARVVITPERQAAIDRRFIRARAAAAYRDVDRDMAGIPIEPAGPPGADVFAERAAELTPEDASDAVRAGIAQVAAFAHRRAERQWQKQQSDAGVAALEWAQKNAGASLLKMPPDIRDWLAPDQWRGLEAFYIEGRLATDRDLFERLDRLLVYEPDAFAGADLARHRLSLDDEDHARFVGGQKAITDGTSDPAFIRYRRARLDADRTLEAKGIDTDGPVAATVRADIRDGLHSFEAIEGRPPNGQDIAVLVAEAIDRSVGEDSPAATPANGAFDPGNIILAQAGGGGSRGGGGGGSGRGPQTPPAATSQRPPTPGPGHNQPPREIPPGLPNAIEKWRRWTQPPVQPPAAPPPPDIAGPRAAAEQTAEERAAIYDTYREHLQELDPDNALLKLEPVPGVPPDRNTVDSYEREVTRVVKKKIDDRTAELKAQSTYSNDSDVRTIGGEVDLRFEFDKLKIGGTRIYKARGQYKEGGSGELYALPGSDGLQVGFRMAHDMQKGTRGSVPTLEIIVPGRDPVKFHYNSER